MSPERKLKQLASADATLQSFLGGSTPQQFRWFSPTLPQGYTVKGTCVRVWRVSTSSMYEQRGRNPMEWCRFQVEVYDTNDETVKARAQQIANFLETVSLASTAQFGSPVVAPPNCPNFQLNWSEATIAQMQPPTLVYSVRMDWKIWNLLN